MLNRFSTFARTVFESVLLAKGMSWMSWMSWIRQAAMVVAAQP